MSVSQSTNSCHRAAWLTGYCPDQPESGPGWDCQCCLCEQEHLLSFTTSRAWGHGAVATSPPLGLWAWQLLMSLCEMVPVELQGKDTRLTWMFSWLGQTAGITRIFVQEGKRENWAELEWDWNYCSNDHINNIDRNDRREGRSSFKEARDFHESIHLVLLNLLNNWPSFVHCRSRIQNNALSLPVKVTCLAFRLACWLGPWGKER